MKKLLTILLLLPIVAMATNGHEHQQQGYTSQVTAVHVDPRTSSNSVSTSQGGAAYGGAATANSSSTGGNASNKGNKLTVNQEYPNQVASQGAVFAAPSPSQMSCDGTVGGAVNTPFSGLTAIWGHTDSTCPYNVAINHAKQFGLQHEACLIYAQYTKSQDINFNVVMCENVHNTNIYR